MEDIEDMTDDEILASLEKPRPKSDRFRRYVVRKVPKVFGATYTESTDSLQHAILRAAELISETDRWRNGGSDCAEVRIEDRKDNVYIKFIKGSGDMTFHELPPRRCGVKVDGRRIYTK